MSLYSIKEICGSCKHAVFYECGNCLKECKVNTDEQKVSLIEGYCENKDVKK